MPNPRLARDSVLGSVALDASEVAPVFQAPTDAAVAVRGFVLGSALEYAHLALSNNAYSPVANASFPFRGNVFTVPVGSPFRVKLSPGQTLLALGSVGVTATGGVWVTFAADYQTPEATFEAAYDVSPADGAGTPGPAGVVGPAPFWRKR